MTPHVGLSVCLLLDPSVCHILLKGRKLNFHAPLDALVKGFEQENDFIQNLPLTGNLFSWFIEQLLLFQFVQPWVLLCLYVC